MRVRSILCFVCAITLSVPTSLHTWVAVADDRVPQELEEFQAYLDPAPLGMDVRYAWTLPGGKGENVKIVDIELNWNLNHNDLAAAVSDAFILVKGIDSLPDATQNQANMNHGTAVLGGLVAADDGIGVTGIAHRARLGLVNPLTNGTAPDVAGAIRRAASRLDQGDVMLLELSVAGPRFDPFGGRGLAPVEFEPAIFTAIKEATSSGIIVVESAGNGFEDLDHPAYAGAFNRSNRNSGAIIVGAGRPEGGIYGSGPDRTRTEESNYGSRVDLQGWGRFVTTCGYGDLRFEQGPNNWYTIDFGATSAAAAMVAGAAAVLQSIVKERGREPLTPVEMRLLLVSTGTPQAGNLNEHIGPRPNLRAAIEGLDSLGVDPAITSVKLKNGGAKLVVDGSGFTTGDSIIEINGTAVPKHKYPAEFRLLNGQTTRLVTKGDISGLVPSSGEVSIVVFTPSSGKRSEPFMLTR
ncbi:MAG TPA: S8 family serine peptidase [Blastocatellia bacterium]|nr:S8 family serine peptidase [Blastocatellia bacterium]